MTIQRRKHHKIKQELPNELVEAVNKRLVEGHTYREITDWIKNEGYEISKSSVGRYGKDFLSRLERLKVIKEQAKTIVEQSADRPATEMHEAANQMAMQLIMETLQKAESGKMVEEESLTQIMKVLAKLETSAAKREKVKLAFNRGVNAAVESLKEELRQELSENPELVNQITEIIDKKKNEVKN